MEKDLPNRWIETKLELATDILDNLRKPINSTERGARTGNIPYYGATGQAGWIDDYIFNEELVLLGEDGAPFLDKSRDVAYLVNGKSWVNNHAHVLKAKDNVSTNRFLLYFLNQFDYKDFVGGTTRLKLTQGDLRNIPIPLPPLPEQQRIVAKLDTLFGQLDRIKASMERIPQLLKDFRQKVLTQAVTGKLTEEWREGKKLEEWKIQNFGDLIIDTPKNGAYYHRSLYGTGTKIIRIDCFYDGKLKDWDLVQRVRVDDKDKLIYQLKVGDILVNRVNSIEYLGKCLLVENLPEECIFESNMMRIIVDKNLITPEYARTFLISSNGLSELRKNAKHAVNQASINQQDVKAVEINYPPIEEQQEIVRRVESLFAKADRIEASYQKLKVKLEQLPQALLAKAFRGELVAQLPTDGDTRDLLEQIKKLKEEESKDTGKGKRKKLVAEDEVRMVAEDEVRYGK